MAIKKVIKKLNERQTEKINYERGLSIYKRDDMVQQARFSLNIQEQRVILYAMAKVKPTDSPFSEYEFDIKHFYALCGIEDNSYTRLKKIMLNLKKKVWFLRLPSGEESAVSWLEVCRLSEKSGKATVGFHRDVMERLTELAAKDEFYTKYQLKYILSMSCQYSPRLYELLKSYQKNNFDWYFDVDELKYLLDCQNYTRWPDFRRFALDPAVEEINKYTDIKVIYSTETEGRKVVRVNFLFKNKSPSKLKEIEATITAELDGQIDIEEVIKRGEDPEGYSRRRNKFFIED